MINELQILYWMAGILLTANLLAMALFVLYAKLPNGKLCKMICEIILQLDKFADKMENSQKRATAIQQMNAVLGWRGIIIPSALIGWVLDTQVAAIREMQKATHTPDLCKDQEVSDTDTSEIDTK